MSWHVHNLGANQNSEDSPQIDFTFSFDVDNYRYKVNGGDWIDGSSPQASEGGGHYLASVTAEWGDTIYFQTRSYEGEGITESFLNVAVPPPSPSNLTATVGTRSITLNWDNPNNNNISKYQYKKNDEDWADIYVCLLYTSPSPRDRTRSRMPSSA